MILEKKLGGKVKLLPYIVMARLTDAYRTRISSIPRLSLQTTQPILDLFDRFFFSLLLPSFCSLYHILQ